MRGDVYRLRANRGAQGHEQTGGRYGIVLQVDGLAYLSTWFVVPTSASAGQAVHRPEVRVKGLVTRALCDQAACIDPQTRLGEHVGRLNRDDLADVENAMRLITGL